MSDLNCVTLNGRLGSDPSVRTKPNGTPVVSFRMAIADRKSDGNGGYVDSTCWIEVVTFGKTAEVVEKFAGKGRKIGVVGRLQLEEWTTKEGDKKSRHVVIGDRIDIIEFPPKDGDRPAARTEERKPNVRTQERPRPRNDDYGDDSIPF